MAPSTIAGYRTAIASAFRHTGSADVGQSPALSSLLQSFFRAKPRTDISLPSWDLSFVLMALTSPPFEPLETCKRKFLSWKTSFLVLLAAGARRGEVHALAADKVMHDDAPHWTKVILYPHAAFVSKTQLRSSGASALRPINIPSLRSFLGPDMAEDLSLCPVRAIQIYLDRTKDLRAGKRLLFIAYKKGHQGDIHKNTLSGWIRKLLVFTYRTSSGEVLPLSNTRTHEIRAQASSLAFRGSADLEALLQACSWSSSSTFADFYLRDMQLVQDGLRKLGPIVAAQRVIP